VGINGGPEFKFNEAVSFAVDCEDQDEIDYFWEKLVDGGGEHGPCGWLKDRFGLSWQVVPRGMDEVFNHPDPERARRGMEAMLKMGKIDIAALNAAVEGVPAS
jgi:predicted 3-demethylubiquinone-9 3-methyltransferase (glyoxalase superfamily)